MRRTLILSLLVVGAAVALAVGSYSALADAGPVTSVAGAVIGADEPDDGDVAGDADDDVDDDVDGDDVDAEDEDGDNGEGAQAVAQAIANTFEVSPDEVLALHDGGVGFGAIFKLYLLAVAGDTTVEALQAAVEGDGGFAFGKLFKENADELAALSAGEDGMPKNLGQAVSNSKKSDEAVAAVAGAVGDGGGGHGPPDHAPAHGRN